MRHKFIVNLITMVTNERIKNQLTKPRTLFRKFVIDSLFVTS